MFVELATAFIGAGGVTAVGHAFKWLFERRAAKKARSLPNVLNMIHETYGVMNVMLDETRASRILLLRAENGGQIPRLGQALYSSIVYETYRQPLRSVKASWQRQLLDESYLKTLIQMAGEGEIRFFTADLPDGLLKTQFQADGVGATEAWPVYGTDGAFFYLMLNYAKDVDPRWEDARYRDLCRASLTKLNLLFRKQYDKPSGK